MSVRVIRGFIPYALISGLFLVSPLLASAQIEGRVFMVRQGYLFDMVEISPHTIIYFRKGVYYDCKVKAYFRSGPYQAEVKGHGHYEMEGDTIDFIDGETAWYPHVLVESEDRPYLESKALYEPTDGIVVRHRWYELDRSYRKVVKKEVKRYRSGKNFED